MRFFEDGPYVPDTLIEARDLGDVVFFCGAGISAPAGLPDFGGLADDLLDRLAAQESRAARNRDESLDRVFMAMVKEFGGTAVDREMSRALRTPRNADLRYHRAAIDLSRGVDGVAKIVTTNFDLLFERADKSLRGYVPPALPDLAQLQPIQGIVYLHGRLNRANNARAGYIITSADFGRAYLAEGWAARFVRALSERYTIVLLGYSANDPPMRYLLEGLNSRDDPARRSLIYAFVPEGSAAAEESWHDKGVTTIPYAPRDKAHNGLWDSLFAWAGAARDPDAWRAKLVTLAQRQPAELKAFERGQVAHLVSNKPGASAFASAVPPPPAEWLCVFDAYSRYAKAGRLNWREKIEIDPLEIFGLDSDPPRPEERPGGAFVAPGEDLLGWRHGDQQWPERQRLSSYRAEWNNQLPSRLYQLARWFGLVMDQPAAVWWAAGKPLPHPGMVREIDYRLDRGPALPLEVRQFWQSYLDAARAYAEDVQDLRQYEVLERIKKEGWTKAVLRALERALEPAFAVGRGSLSSPIPPAGDWTTLDLRHVVEITVKISRWADGLDPPMEMLAPVVALVRRSLERMAELLAESTTIYWSTPTLHPTGERGESFDHDREASHFLKFQELFAALAAHDPAAARQEVASWDNGDPVFFAKLFLYAASLPDLIAPDVFAQNLLPMPDASFWDSSLSRELLYALRTQWPHLRNRDRSRIESRIVRGRPRREGEGRAEHRRGRSAWSASWLRWLELNGRNLSPSTAGKLPELIAAAPDWSDSWAWNADDSLGSRGGYVERVTETQGLETAPVTQIVALANALSTDDLRQLRDYRPFDGLVTTSPFKALAALRIVARRGEHTAGYWHSLVDNWPEGTSARLNLQVAYTLSRLPEAMFVELRHGIASWTHKYIGGLVEHDRRSGLAALDAIVARYRAAEPETLGSGVGSVRIGGVVQEKSEVSLMKAINAPGGKLAQAVLAFLGTPKRRNRMSAWIATRLDRLLELPGDGAGHAACILARQFRWLDYWFADWTTGLVPFFALDHPLAEAMWHGLASDTHFIGDDAGRRIKPDLIAVLVGDAPWELDEDARRRLIGLMVNLTLARDGKPAVISFAEARRLLIAVGDADRAEALAMLARTKHSDDLWTSLIRPFVLDAWPRQLKYQTEESARQLAQIAEKSGDRFPEVVTIILPFLRSVPHLDTFAYRLKKQGEDGQGYSVRFPAETLALLNALVGDDPQALPWNLGELLELIADAAPALRQSDPWRRLKTFTQ
jgi:hypothetical protein